MPFSKKWDVFELSRLNGPDSLSSLNGFCNTGVERLVILCKMILKKRVPYGFSMQWRILWSRQWRHECSRAAAMPETESWEKLRNNKQNDLEITV